MKIFGIGLSKTGTTSLASALEQLGYRTRDYPGLQSYVPGDLASIDAAVLEDAPAHLGHDIDHVLEDAHVARGRREDVEQQDEDREGHDRDDHHDDLRRRIPRQPLQLDEDQPDEEAVDA